MKEEKKKGKCKYCGREIHSSNIRCYICDLSWQEGFRAGKKDIKERLNETFQSIKNLIQV